MMHEPIGVHLWRRCAVPRQDKKSLGLVAEDDSGGGSGVVVTITL